MKKNNVLLHKIYTHFFHLISNLCFCSFMNDICKFTLFNLKGSQTINLGTTACTALSSITVSQKLSDLLEDFTHVFVLQAPKKAKRRQAAGDGGSSNVFSMFEQSQIQEYKEVRFVRPPSDTPSLQEPLFSTV